jgi:hypothetical protein
LSHGWAERQPEPKKKNYFPQHGTFPVCYSFIWPPRLLFILLSAQGLGEDMAENFFVQVNFLKKSDEY